MLLGSKRNTLLFVLSKSTPSYPISLLLSEPADWIEYELVGDEIVTPLPISKSYSIEPTVKVVIDCSVIWSLLDVLKETSFVVGL